jgi:hypothetical protein
LRRKTTYSSSISDKSDQLTLTSPVGTFAIGQS